MTSSRFNSEENTNALTSEVIFRTENFVISRIIYFHQFRIQKKAVESKAKNPILISALLREFNIGIHLKHPNIVSYFSLHNKGEEGNVIEMEFIDGRNLKQFVELIDSRKTNGAKIISGILQALDYLHSKEIFHLDLKPENIMISNLNKQVKLIDFSHSSTSTHVQSWGSSTHYSAPELHNKKCSAKSDIYSLGKIIEYLQNNDILPKSIVWNTIAKKCTQYNDQNRYQSISEIKHVLRNVQVLKISVFFATVIFLSIFTFFLIPQKKITYNRSQPISLTIQQSAPNDTVNKPKSIKNTLAISNDKTTSSDLKITLSIADSLAIENTVKQFFDRYKNRMDKFTSPSLSNATSIHQEEFVKLLNEWNTISKEYEAQSSGSISSQRVYQNALYRYNLEIGKLNSKMIK